MCPVVTQFFNDQIAAFRDEAGASTVEYAVLGSCVAAVIVLSVADVGQKTKGMFEFVVGIIVKYIS